MLYIGKQTVAPNVLTEKGEVNNQDITVTENNVYTAEPGYTGLGTVTVEVPTEVNNTDPITFTQNDTYEVPQGYTGFGTVTVNVSGGGEIHNQDDKVALENGTVFPDAGYTGLSKVVVNVQGETDIVTALNKSGREVNEGDRVWINEKDGHYTLVPFGFDGNFWCRDDATVDIGTEVAYGFNDHSWIELNTLASSNDYEFVFKFTLSDNVTDFQNIYCFYPVSEMYVENGTLRIFSETVENSISCGSVEAFGTYWGKVVIRNGIATLSYSTNGTTYTGEISVENIDTNPQERKIGNGINWERYFRGTIDFSESYINRNGQRYWTPRVTSITSDTVTGTSKDFIWNGQSGRVYIGDIIEAKLGTKTIRSNGTYLANDDLLDGYSSVVVDVPNSGGEAVLGVKTITSDGTYNAEDDNLDGYSSVTVSTGSHSGGGNYNGMSMSYSQKEGYLPVIHISGGVMSDYASYINPCAGVLAPSGYHYVDSEDVYDDFEKEGNIEVNPTTGVVRTITSRDYLRLKKSFFPQNKDWEVFLKIKTPETIDWRHRPIFGDFSSSPRCFRIALDDWRFKVWVSSNGEHYDIMDNWGGYIYQPNTIYYLRLSKTNNMYTFEVSEDNVEWSTEAYTENTNIVSKSILSIGGHNSDSFDGTVYLDESYVKINNKLWWNGRTHEHYAGLLADGVVDDGTAKTYNLFWNNGFVLDTAQEKQDWEWCGLVGVPAHTVNSIQADSEADLIGSEKITLEQYTNDNYHKDRLYIDRENEDFPEVTVTFTQSSLYPSELYKIGQYTDAKIVNFPNLTTVSANALREAFSNHAHLRSLNFPVLQNAEAYKSLYYVASNCYELENIEFPELTVIGDQSFYEAFSNNVELKQASFPKLTSIGTYGSSRCFSGTAIKNITFPLLSSLGECALEYAFSGIGEVVVNLPALNENSFGNFMHQFYRIFENSMFSELHVPYRVRHIMQNWDFNEDVSERLGNELVDVVYDLTSGLVNFIGISDNVVIYRDNEKLTRDASLNYIKEGNPTIDEQNLTLTDFSRYNFIWPNYHYNNYRPYGLFFYSWEGKMKIKTPTTMENNLCYFGSEWNDQGTNFYIQDGHFAFRNGWDGWFCNEDLKQSENSYTGAHECATETDYWIKFGWNNETYEYYLEYSTDGVTYTKDISYYSDRAVRHDCPQRLGAWCWDDDTNSNGAVIYLDKFSLIDNKGRQYSKLYIPHSNSDRFNLGNTSYTAYDETNNKVLFGTISNVTDQEERDVTLDMSGNGNKLSLVLNKENLTPYFISDGLKMNFGSESSTIKSINHLGENKTIDYVIPRSTTTARTEGTVTLTSSDQTVNVNVENLPVRDFTVVGSPTISVDNILSDCTYEDYLTINVSELPEYGFEFIVKAQSFNIENYNYKQIISYESTDPEHGDYTLQFGKKWEDRLGVRAENSPWGRYEDNGEWFPADYTGWFWYAFKQYDWGFEHYYILDDGYTLDTLPALPANWDDESQWSRCGRTDWRDVRMVNGVYHIAQCDRWDDTWPTQIDLKSMVFRDSTTGFIYWRPINEAE